MKFSVITPVKNLESYISETIESVINQRGDFDLEYIIVDGNSEDNTLKICKEYQVQIETNSRIKFCNSIDFKIISKPDFSMYEALCSGLQIARGDIISYINGDDFYLPNAFSCVNEIFSKFNHVKWLTGIPFNFNQNGQIVDFRIPWHYNSNLLKKGFYGKNLPFVQQESVFWKKECLEKVNIEKLKEFKLAGDYFLWHSFASNDYQLHVVDSLLGGNRIRIGQLSKNKTDYYKEFDAVKGQSNIFDRITAYFFWVIEIFGGKILKRRILKNRIHYKESEWIIN